MSPNQRAHHRARITLAAFSLASSMVVVVFRVLLGAGIDVYSWVSWPGAFFELLGFLSFGLWSLANVAFRDPSPALRYGPAAATLLAVILVWPGGLERRVTTWNFWSRLEARTAVVALVRSGRIDRGEPGPCDCYYARLPPEYAHLSAGGVISVAPRGADVSVTFFVSKAAYFGDDNYTAFVFRTDEGQPATGVEDTYDFVDVTPWAPHWWFVIHT